MRRRDPAAAIGASPPQLRSPACPRNARHAARCSLVRRRARRSLRHALALPAARAHLDGHARRLRAPPTRARRAPDPRTPPTRSGMPPASTSRSSEPAAARTVRARCGAAARRGAALSRPCAQHHPLAESRETLSANATFFGRVQYSMVMIKKHPAAGRSESACARLFPFFFFFRAAGSAGRRLAAPGGGGGLGLGLGDGGGEGGAAAQERGALTLERVELPRGRRVAAARARLTPSAAALSCLRCAASACAARSVAACAGGARRRPGAQPTQS